MIKDREEALRRKKEIIRQAVRRYEKKFKRINCRLDPELYEKILQTGMSANSFINNAVAEKLDRMEGNAMGYPSDFFSLFGAGNELGFDDEPADPAPVDDMEAL